MTCVRRASKAICKCPGSARTDDLIGLDLTLFRWLAASLLVRQITFTAGGIFAKSSQNASLA